MGIMKILQQETACNAIHSVKLVKIPQQHALSVLLG